MRLPQPILSLAAAAALRAPRAARPVFRSALRGVGMPLTGRFVEYAIDFEHAYVTDDWSDVRERFAPDAVYEVRRASFGCHIEGRDRIVAGFKRFLDGFDRRLERKIVIREGPHESDAEVTFLWVGHYRRGGGAALALSARQTARYRGEEIALLVDDYLPGVDETATAWVERSGALLDPRYQA